MFFGRRLCLGFYELLGHDGRQRRGLGVGLPPLRRPGKGRHSTLLTKVEVEENKALRLACVGQTDYEQALPTYRNDNGVPPLVAALAAKDEDAAEALLDGEADPNAVDVGCQGRKFFDCWIH